MTNPAILAALALSCLVLLIVGCQSVPEKATSDHPASQALREDPATSRPQADRASHTVGASRPKAHSRLVRSASIGSEPEAAPSADPPPAATNLWARLRAGFQLTIPDQARVEQELRWFTKSNGYLERVQQRALPYLYYIVEEVEKRGLPMELALLPVVESGFQPFAYSPGRAAGLWQFIPSTGRLYGLQQNWWYDGRRDVVAATNAALDYLETLSKRFNGDWELALAAYNAGAGGVQRAINKNRRAGKPTDFWSLSLPRETASYVPRLLALSKVVAQPAAYGLALAPIPNRPYFASVEIGSQLDLALAAEMAEISMDELYRLNPGFNRWATAPDGPHRLQLPRDKVGRFEQRLARLQPEDRLRWKRYEIRRGDNLGAIARRHGTTVALLQEVNEIKGTQIRAGKHLLIPLAAKELDHYSLSAGQRKAQIKNQPQKGKRLTHIVKAGDTLWDIARRYRVGYRALARWNGMSPRDTLRLGQELVVWTMTVAETASTSGRSVDLAMGPTGTQSSLTYKVRKGDSLARIADRFNVSVSQLREWNTLPSKYLQPGQQLTLYVDVTTQTL